jgi:peptidyl-dipeptidase A
MSARRAAILCGAGVCVLVAQLASRGQTPLGKNESNKPAPSAEEAKKYIANAETELLDLGVKASRASWVEENFITEDTEKITADANEVLNPASTTYAKKAHRFDGLKLEPELARKRLLLELAAGFPAPNDPKAQKERTSWRHSMAIMEKESGARMGKRESAWTLRRWGN